MDISKLKQRSDRAYAIALEKQMKLAEWLVERGMSQADLARDLQVTQPAVHHWLNGVQPPNGHRMMQIYRMSKGKVGLRDWCEEFDGQL